MPVIHVAMLQGRSKDQKAKLAQAMTQVFVEIAKAPGTGDRCHHGTRQRRLGRRGETAFGLKWRGRVAAERARLESA